MPGWKGVEFSGYSIADSASVLADTQRTGGESAATWAGVLPFAKFVIGALASRCRVAKCAAGRVASGHKRLRVAKLVERLERRRRRSWFRYYGEVDSYFADTTHGLG